jgi:serine/threonine protein kinase
MLGGARTRVAIKLLRPRAVRQKVGLARFSVEKEVAALERISRRMPPVPYVVRFLDTGFVRTGVDAIELPWLAIEYVDGEAGGTTLRTRVQRSLQESGYAFPIERARRAATAMIAGVEAMHEVGVIHRDLAPGNVLCCGADAGELFKISDLGLARVDNAATFGNVLLGTPGYCAPEQSFPEKVGVGPHTDVFSLACLVYFTLTCEEYFAAPTIPEMLVTVFARERRSLLDSPGLCPALRGLEVECRAIDQILDRSTRPDPRDRPRDTAQLRAELLPHLAIASR